jgi:hypothetical protein
MKRFVIPDAVDLTDIDVTQTVSLPSRMFSGSIDRTSARITRCDRRSTGCAACGCQDNAKLTKASHARSSSNNIASNRPIVASRSTCAKFAIVVGPPLCRVAFRV